MGKRAKEVKDIGIIGAEIFLPNISFKTVIEESFGRVGKREGDAERV